MPGTTGSGGYQPYGGWQPKPDEKQEQEAARKKLMRRGGIAFFSIALIAASAIWNPPTGSVHSFTEASDYSLQRDSGCTNSGEGCHGSETAYTDFNAYHPNIECTDCHDYQGVGCIPCHSPQEHECQVCHDGSVEGAPDRTKITDPYPRGHYRETTHTAMGTPFDEPMTTTEDGEASATCKDCHSRDLKNAHTGVTPVQDSDYGDGVGCGECHNDTRAQGLAQVKADWKKRSCEACHTKKSSSPMHDAKVASSVEPSGSAGCAATGSGCHDDVDLHGVHANAPKNCSGSAAKGEPGCHNLKLEASVPTATACGGGEDEACHADYTNDALSHKKDRDLHAPDSDAPAADTSYYATACGECHLMARGGTSLIDEHARTTSGSIGCRDCHNALASGVALDADTPDYKSVACDTCHGHEGLDAAHAGDLTAAHEAADSAGCANSGVGCHPTADLSLVGGTAPNPGLHAACIRCHAASPGDGNVAWDPNAKSCGEGRACHGSAGAYSPATDIHAGGASRVDGRDSLHDAGGAVLAATFTDDASGLTVACGSCHGKVLGTEHTRANSAIASGTDTVCTRCHNANAAAGGVVKRDWQDSGNASACADCHGKGGAPAAHGAIATAHSGGELTGSGVLEAGACQGAGCHDTADLRVLHKTSGCATSGCHQSTGDIRGLGITTCGGDNPERSCHAGYSASAGHADTGAHKGTELNLAGDPSPGFCATAGCHTSTDLKKVHGANGCGVEGCHSTKGVIGATSCGGTKSATSCHAGFSAGEHFYDHSADLTGTVNDITYGPGTNTGCFGCHNPDLITEHTATSGSPIAGGSASNCRVCHYDSSDAGSGDYADLPAVTSALKAKDRRCVSCHKSGTSEPDASAAASPHKRTSDKTPLPVGSVWADPFAEWKAAFESPMGGGHNALPADLVGASVSRLFPLTSYEVSGTTFTWALPPNSGDTLWLRASAFPGQSVDTTEGIRHLTVGCSDCHVMSAAMAGPHGAAVKVLIDPAYSQTEYSNPTRALSSQFAETGANRVICMKCHNLEVGSVPGTSTPGGSPVHAKHAQHLGFPSYHPLRYGEKCIDCHVRIPHAWRNPRLLVRTVGTDGIPADTYPYIQKGYDGLAGIRLRDFTAPDDLGKESCATGGCHGYHDDKTHPMPEDIPGAAYWP